MIRLPPRSTLDRSSAASDVYKRQGLQDDIAKACAFLASDQATYITGEAMNVSGGEEYH